MTGERLPPCKGQSQPLLDTVYTGYVEDQPGRFGLVRLQHCNLFLRQPPAGADRRPGRSAGRCARSACGRRPAHLAAPPTARDRERGESRICGMEGSELVCHVQTLRLSKSPASQDAGIIHAMLFRQKPKARQSDKPMLPPDLSDSSPAPSPLDVVLAYHAATKHYPYRSARSLGYMDWDTQPDPFRRYAGAHVLPLDEISLTAEPGYDAIFQPEAVEPRPLDRAFVSQLFYNSLALSAWKEYGDSRWSLRVNPSSGNLHPTEGYLLAGPIPGLLAGPALCHYAPFEHGLEVRRDLPVELWQAVAGQLPPGAFLIGLTSIYWREFVEIRRAGLSLLHA